MLLELHLRCTGLFIQGSTISLRSGGCAVGIDQQRPRVPFVQTNHGTLPRTRIQPARNTLIARSLFLCWEFLLPLIRHCFEPTGSTMTALTAMLIEFQPITRLWTPTTYMLHFAGGY